MKDLGKIEHLQPKVYPALYISVDSKILKRNVWIVSVNDQKAKIVYQVSERFNSFFGKTILKHSSFVISTGLHHSPFNHAVFDVDQAFEHIKDTFTTAATYKELKEILR